MADPDRRFLDRLHELCEWECELSYHDGYAAGYAAATAAMAEALRFALGGSAARGMREAVDGHLWSINARKRRAAADTPGPRPGDYGGGPIPFAER